MDVVRAPRRGTQLSEVPATSACARPPSLVQLGPYTALRTAVTTRPQRATMSNDADFEAELLATGKQLDKVGSCSAPGCLFTLLDTCTNVYRMAKSTAFSTSSS